MTEFTLKIRPHYSGLFQGRCVERPSIFVLGRDHEEVACLAEKAWADREPAAAAAEPDR